ncbi:hypothetical protein [Mucilaginibacter glaciei]|uniref:Uncharacterized protein n=1 Tax=Mucilaginibacter glaciei TaxID=2772109 RepID=A0A926S015_9SPHI|nr:hypothetical protein [Mucilaginibacter glaciei]MBD1391553.1 hypothetical protein [Mucilaginibacter glaciei]
MKKLSTILCGVAMIMVIASCKKESSGTTTAPVIKSLATLGLYEYTSGTSKRVFMPVTKVGTQTVNYYTVFDTGSSGLTLDASGIIPASMITTNGFQFTGDSVVVNGITITSKTSIMSYGDATNLTKEYGNVAYATFTLGDANGNIATKRIPFFLYYKVMNSVTNTQLPAHSVDIMGVGPGYSFASTLIQSPLSYFDVGTDLKQGYRLAAFNAANFTTAGNYVAGLVSIGLTPTDLATSTGFILHPLTFSSSGGYSGNIPGTVVYNGTSTAAQFLFDTGNPTQTIIENTKETNAIGALPANSTVTITTNRGFKYSYVTTSTTNLTTVQNPNNTNDYRSIISIDFFINNQYMMDYTNHQIGLKNN